jgi:leucyl aminopeptidase
MLTCFTQPNSNATLITPIITENFSAWLNQQPEKIKNWITVANFSAKPETFCLIPDENGRLTQVLLGVKDTKDFWSFGVLPTNLPKNNYHIEKVTDHEQMTRIAIAWGLGAYQFTRYKQPTKTIASLVIPEICSAKQIENMVEAIYLVRDLINTPTEHMGPMELAQAALDLSHTFNAKVTQIVGDDLLTNNYPTIHAVGRASHRPPHLIDLRWGDSNAPKITLVGKGVCFDSGGLDIKSASAMALMKKDMGGAAHVLGLARMIMAANLPVRLRVLIPAVENVISGSAFKPGDVIKTRKGLTVEIGNTDAEGRLVLCDALAEAVTEQPDLLIDFATLTGASRVAVGTEIAALFSNQDELAQQLITYGEQEQDPIWRLPLFASYRKLIDSKIADINNSGDSPYAGAITAALFLKEFVPDTIPWAHFDLHAWNASARAGRPDGGEAMALRAVFGYLAKRYL